MESTQSDTAYIGPDRGVCAECGQAVMLRVMDGMVRRHGPHGACPGGGRPPAKAGDIPENIPPD